MVTAPSQQKTASDAIISRSGAIDRDKRSIENAALVGIYPILTTARDHAQQAIRIGYDAAQAARDVIDGNERIRQHGLGYWLEWAAIAAWLLGYWRTLATAAAMDTGKPHSIAAIRKAITQTRDFEHPNGAYREAIAGVRQRVGVETLAARVGSAEAVAGRQAKTLTLKLSERLGGIRVDLGPSLNKYVQPGAHLPDDISRAMDEARIAFRKSGLDRNHAFLIETVTEAVVAKNYEEGRDSGADSTTGARLVHWGWIWSSVIDDHECPRCAKLHETQAPIGDPLWQQFGPQAHFGCRCCRLEVWKRRDDADPPIRRPNLTDEDIIRIVRDRQALERFWQGFDTP